VKDYSNELQSAREFAEAGSRVAMRHYRANPQSKRKSDGTWVTEADWAAEAQIRLRIARAWPDHNVLGEEEGLSAAGGGPATPGAPTWVIDPIDGTHNYMAGIPIWATLVGLRIDDATVVGVCSAPALGEVYEAGAGSGARMNGEPIAVDPLDTWEDSTVLMPGAEVFAQHGMSEFLYALIGKAWRSRGFGEFWGHMLVARGAAHVMVEPELNLWDICALEVIVAEAGGRTTTLDGGPWTEAGPALTTNGRLHDDVLRLAANPSGE
jgi:histidinol-phosphatase